MIPAVVMICLLLFCSAAVPVKLAFLLRVSHGLRFGAGVSVFNGRIALRSARQRALGEKPHWKFGKKRFKPDPGAALAAGWTALRYILARLHPEQLRAEGRISASDAAVTALLCGGARAAEGVLAPFMPSNSLRVSLQPDFSASGSDAEISGMVSIRAGHIICAALKGAWNYFILTRRQKHGKASD